MLQCACGWIGRLGFVLDPECRVRRQGNSSKVFICKKEAGKLRVMKLAGRLSGQAVTRRIHRWAGGAVVGSETRKKKKHDEEKRSQDKGKACFMILLEAELSKRVKIKCIRHTWMPSDWLTEVITDLVNYSMSSRWRYIWEGGCVVRLSCLLDPGAVDLLS